MEWVIAALKDGGPAVAVIVMAIGVSALWFRLLQKDKEIADERAACAAERDKLQDKFVKEHRLLQDARIAELREVLAAMRPVEDLAEEVGLLVARVEQLLAKSRR